VENVVKKIYSRITYAATVWSINENRFKNYQCITNNLLTFRAYCKKKEAVKRDDGG